MYTASPGERSRATFHDPSLIYKDVESARFYSR